MPQKSPPPAPRDGSGGPSRPSLQQGLPKWSLWVFLGLLVAAFLLPNAWRPSDRQEMAYNTFIDQVEAEHVESVTWNNVTGEITGELDDGTEFVTNGPTEPPHRTTSRC